MDGDQPVRGRVRVPAVIDGSGWRSWGLLVEAEMLEGQGAGVYR